MNLTKELFKSKLTEYEFYVSKKHHMLNNYKEYIEKYIELCKIEGNYLNTNNKYIQSLKLTTSSSHHGSCLLSVGFYLGKNVRKASYPV